MIKYTINLITLLRIVMVLFLFFLTETPWFVWGYLLAGLTDVLDGFLARKFNASTKIGAQLDSFADLFLFALIMTVIYHRILNMFPYYWFILAILFGLKLGAILLTYIKFREIAIIHTLGNKLLGLCLFIIPLCPIIQQYHIHILLVIAVLVLIDEFLIIFMSKTLDLNVRSFIDRIHVYDREIDSKIKVDKKGDVKMAASWYEAKEGRAEHLVYLDKKVQELEKLLAGSKVAIIRGAAGKKVPLGGRVKVSDVLYFVETGGDFMVKYKASVKSVLETDRMTPEASVSFVDQHQEKLQLTNDQKKRWAGKKFLCMIEIEDLSEITPFKYRRESNMDDWVITDDIRKIRDV